LGWSPKISFVDLVHEMVDADLSLAQRDDYCKREGFNILNRHE
jgi:GDPmannose 4,6-dehydratase